MHSLINDKYRVCDLNVGGGGAALGWEQAGFAVTAIDGDEACCHTLTTNRPLWSVHRAQIRGLPPGLGGRTADAVSAKVPCPPLLAREGFDDLIPEVALAAAELEARALVVSMPPAPASERYAPYRRGVEAILTSLGYAVASWSLVDAGEFGVAQHRRRCLLVALRADLLRWWLEPKPRPAPGVTVSRVLSESMTRRGMDFQHAKHWTQAADELAPTLVASPRGHTPDLGPARAKRAWAAMGIDGRGIAAEDDPVTPSGPNGRGPYLTVGQICLLQGMPSGWVIRGDTHERARQACSLSNPQIFRAYGAQIRAALRAADANAG